MNAVYYLGTKKKVKNMEPGWYVTNLEYDNKKHILVNAWSMLDKEHFQLKYKDLEEFESDWDIRLTEKLPGKRITIKGV